MCVVIATVLNFGAETVMAEEDQRIADEEEEEGAANHGPWWHVNKGGFPVPELTWDKMWEHVTSTHPEGDTIVRAIRGTQCKRVSYPSVPVVSMSQGPVQASLNAVQTYLQDLQYNHTGTQFFEIRKNRPLSRLMEVAKDMIQESLPIKCLESVVLSLYLTAPLTEVQRFAVSFKSRCGELCYRHIVLGVHYSGFYGALGLSRREDLMFKPLQYKSLYDLVHDFMQSYSNYQHTVLKLKLSSPIVHDVHSNETIHWKFVAVSVKSTTEDELKKVLEKFSRHMKTTQQ